MSEARIIDLSGNSITAEKSPEDLTIRCVHCGGIFFTQLCSFDKVSALLGESGKPQLAPKNVITICAECGEQLVIDPITGDPVKKKDDTKDE